MPVNDTPNFVVEELVKKAAERVVIKLPETDADRIRRVRRSGIVHEGMDDFDGKDWKDRPKGTGKRLKAAEERINAELHKNLRESMAMAMVEGSYQLGDKTPPKPRTMNGQTPQRYNDPDNDPMETPEETRRLEDRRKLFEVVNTVDANQTQLIALLKDLGLEAPTYEELSESDENLFL